ncbi:hypothetical protein DPMN_096950 [Dreissena polymorpha]|uniref:Uncharacterized protein n=1 Tax=Dreissena polymorpha TaxID=45954 RepID=A0A9D4L9N9_DREPO|nr:hypothetical protein DPMN_096950 [Dreissena polymorpha]
MSVQRAGSVLVETRLLGLILNMAHVSVQRAGSFQLKTRMFGLVLKMTHVSVKRASSVLVAAFKVRGFQYSGNKKSADDCLGGLAAVKIVISDDYCTNQNVRLFVRQLPTRACQTRKFTNL